MLVNLMGFSLDPKGAGTLKSYVSAHQSSVSADALVDHVLSLGAGYAVIEEPYVDKDYSADYLNFYAAAFRNYPRHTKRIHLFAKSVEPALRLPMAEQQTALEEALAELGASRIVLAGAATNWCIRATAHGALDRGYDLTLIEDAHTTESMGFADGTRIEAADLVRELNVAMTWLSYPGRSTTTARAEAVDLGALAGAS